MLKITSHRTRIGHHYVNVLRKNKVAKSGKKIQSFANKNRRYQLKNFKSMNPIRRQRILQPSFHIQKKKRLGLQRNLIFNQGIKYLWVFEVVVVVMGRGRGRGESRKMCVPLEKSWLPPWLERKWSIGSLFRLGSSHVVFLISLIHEVKDNISFYKSKKRFSSWTISFGKIRRLRLEKSRDFVES